MKHHAVPMIAAVLTTMSLPSESAVAEPSAVHFIYNNGFVGADFSTEIYVQVVGDTAGLASFMIEVAGLDVNDPMVQDGTLWEQNQLWTVVEGFQPLGFVTLTQGLNGNSLYSVNSSQEMSGPIFGIGMSPISMTGAFPPATQLDIGVPALLGRFVPGAGVILPDDISVSATLYDNTRTPTGLLSPSETVASFGTVFGSPAIGATIDFGEVAQGDIDAAVMSDAISLNGMTTVFNDFNTPWYREFEITGPGAAVFDVLDMEELIGFSVDGYPLSLSLDVNAEPGTYEAKLDIHLDEQFPNPDGIRNQTVSYNLRATIVPEPGAAAVLLGVGAMIRLRRS